MCLGLLQGYSASLNAERAGSALILSQIPVYTHKDTTNPRAPAQSSWLSGTWLNFPQHITTHNSSFQRAGRGAPSNTAST